MEVQSKLERGKQDLFFVEFLSFADFQSYNIYNTK